MHDYGGKIEITLHIRLNKETRLNEAHERASQVEKAVKENIRGVEVTVHIEPEKEENEKKD
jgi:divalent metal cation (Fe/Co/Zn/Cd) transporter